MRTKQLGILCLIASALFVVAPSIPSIGAQPPGVWGSNTSIMATNQSSCVYSGGYYYCINVGGQAFYGATSAGASPSPQSSTTSYPSVMDSNYPPTCEAYQGYIYCVGGTGGAGNGATAYAHLTSSGIGSWTTGTFPTASNIAMGCGIGAGFIYCVGGWNGVISGDTNSYAASVSPSGFGAWTTVAVNDGKYETQGCVYFSGDLICEGGLNGIGGSPCNCGNYATVSGTTISAFSATTHGPAGHFSADGTTSCIVFISEVMCNPGKNAPLMGPATLWSYTSNPISGTWTNSTGLTAWNTGFNIFSNTAAITDGSTFINVFLLGTGGHFVVYNPNTPISHQTIIITKVVACNFFQLQCWAYPMMFMGMYLGFFIGVASTFKVSEKSTIYLLLTGATFCSLIEVVLGIMTITVPIALIILNVAYSFRLDKIVAGVVNRQPTQNG